MDIRLAYIYKNLSSLFAINRPVDTVNNEPLLYKFFTDLTLFSIKIVKYGDTLAATQINESVQGEVVYLFKSAREEVTPKNIRNLVQISKASSEDVVQAIYHQLKQVFMPSL